MIGDLPETLQPVSLVVSVAAGLTLDDVRDDAQYLADVLGCTVMFVLDGAVHVVRPSENAGERGG